MLGNVSLTSAISINFISVTFILKLPLYLYLPYYITKPLPILGILLKIGVCAEFVCKRKELPKNYVFVSDFSLIFYCEILRTKKHEHDVIYNIRCGLSGPLDECKLHCAEIVPCFVWPEPQLTRLKVLDNIMQYVLS